MDHLDEYYNTHDEDGRLLSRHGKVEYLTTMKYVNEYLALFPSPKVLEIGAGTGRYSVTLAKRGCSVTAVELIPHNLEILRSKLDGGEPITAVSGNALDLSFLPDETFDLTLMLGPMYHLYTEEDQRKALGEALRVTKPGGYLFVAYCMNEPTVIQFVFGRGGLTEVLENDMLTKDWHCKSEPKDIFAMARTEDIARLDSAFPVERIKLIATDGPAHYIKDMIDGMDEKTFGYFMDYHFSVCERQDLIGASNHTLDILKKI